MQEREDRRCRRERIDGAGERKDRRCRRERIDAAGESICCEGERLDRRCRRENRQCRRQKGVELIVQES